MEKLSVLHFENYLDYLNYIVSPVSQVENRPKTLELWAKRLGYKSPSSLSMVIKGQRLPSHDLVVAMAFDLDLSEEEGRYLQLLVQLEKEKRKKKDVSRTLEFLKKIKKHKSYNNIDLAEFEYISQWYFLAIKNLVATKWFVEDYDWIAKQLKGKITATTARDATIKMIQIGVLIRNENGHLCWPNEGISTGNDIPSAAIRNHHKEMMTRASEALEEVDIELRQLSSLTLAVSSEKITEAKGKILAFFNEFNDQYAVQAGGDHVYQLNIQFFPHALKGEVIQ